MCLLQIQHLLVDEIFPYENNPRNNDKAVDAVAESIKQYGFKVPIVVDSNKVIITGHTRLRAAQKLGLERVPCIIAVDLTEPQARAYRIADNKVNELSFFDDKRLLEELEAIDSEWFTGFSESDKFSDIKLDGLFGDDEVGEHTHKLVVKSASHDRLEMILETIRPMLEAEDDATIS